MDCMEEYVERLSRNMADAQDDQCVKFVATENTDDQIPRP